MEDPGGGLATAEVAATSVVMIVTEFTSDVGAGELAGIGFVAAAIRVGSARPVARWLVMTESTSAAGPLVHLCSKPDWLRAYTQGRLEPDSLQSVGFVHLSALSQVHIPANALFAGRDDLVLLEIDVERVPAPIRWEDGDPPHPDGVQFPHLYGPLPVTSVTRVHDYRPNGDGSFLPRHRLRD